MVVESNYLIQLVFISSSITFSADLATLKIPLGSPFPGTYLSLRGTAWLTQRISWLDSVCPITRGSAINGTFVASITLPRQFSCRPSCWRRMRLVPGGALKRCGGNMVRRMRGNGRRRAMLPSRAGIRQQRRHDGCLGAKRFAWRVPHGGKANSVVLATGGASRRGGLPRQGEAGQIMVQQRAGHLLDRMTADGFQFLAQAENADTVNSAPQRAGGQDAVVRRSLGT